MMIFIEYFSVLYEIIIVNKFTSNTNKLCDNLELLFRCI